MQELRFVAVSEDGRYAVLAVPGRSARYTLPIDERLRAVALGQTSRLVQYEIEVESPLRPKEIQARIRAGETVEEIADAAGIAVERVRWFEGPVLAERAYAADQAQRASVRRLGDAAPSIPGPQLGEIVTERLKAFGSDPEDAQWDAKKRDDGSWQVRLTFISGGRLHVAEWVFDPRRRHVLPADDNAARMSLPGGEPPQPAAPPLGEATVTQLAPRLSPASGQGFGQSGTGTSGFGPVSPAHSGPGNGSRPRHERTNPSRPPVSEPVPPVLPAAAPEARSDNSPPSVAGRHSLPPEASSPPEPSPLEAAASRPAETFVTEPPAAPAPPANPATVAAQVSKAGRVPQPTRAAQPAAAGSPQPSAEEARPEAAAPAARPEPATPAATAPGGSEPAAPAEPAAEQARRQARKAARGKRASVPSWDEIMFGNARQRD
ncbi:MAG: septation protein SepH [Actinomycetota bacterium]|nr:septation protein SepH [Actinomycetota bacterium]